MNIVRRFVAIVFTAFFGFGATSSFAAGTGGGGSGGGERFLYGTITLNDMGAITPSSPSVIYEYNTGYEDENGNTITSITPPTRTGYTYNGHRTSGNICNGGNCSVISSNGTIASNLHEALGINQYQLDVYASWNPKIITVTLNHQGANTNGSPSRVYLKYNTGWYSNSGASTSITQLSTVPTKNNYTFGGYYTGTNGSGVQVIDSLGHFKTTSAALRALSSNGTIYAKWVSGSASIYTVTLKPNNNNQSNTDQYIYVKTNVDWYADSRGRTPIYASIFDDLADGGAGLPVPQPQDSSQQFNGYWTSAKTPVQVTDRYGNILIAPTFVANTTLWAHWDASGSVLMFDYDDGDSTSCVADGTFAVYGEDMPALDPCAMAVPPTGYTFNGFWDDNVSPSVQYYTASLESARVWNQTSSPVELTAHYSPALYTVTYTCGTGTGTPPAAELATYDAAFTAAANTCTKSGYVFAGWLPRGESNVWVDGNMWRFTEGKSFDAQWSTAAYNINYVLNGGTNYAGAPATYTPGVGATISGTPTRDNSAFGGWCTDSGLTTCSNTQTIASNETGDKTFYAKWTCNNGYSVGGGGTACDPNVLTLDWDENGGGAVSNDTCKYGSKLVLPSAPTRTGYTFTKWKLADGTLKDASSTVTGGCTYTYTNAYSGTSTAIQAQWTANTDTAYKVYHYTKNTTGSAYTQNGNVDNLTGTSDASLTLANLTRSITGFTYDKGFADTSASGTTIPASGSVTTTTILPDGTRVISLYYNRNSYSISYTMNGGTNYSGAPESYTYGVGATISGTPTRDNSTFGGWCTNSGLTTCANTQTISTTDTGNKTFYAKWTCNNGYTANSGNTACTPNNYTITLDNGSATTNGTATLYTTKDTNVYRNSGRTEVMTTSANPITKPSRVYTVSYEAHSGSVSPSSTNTTATYTFNGYYSAASNGTQYISSNGNITANGISAGKGYTSNSNTWNAQWTSGSVTLATPSRAGYTFNGWYTAATGGTRRGGAGDSYTPTADETLHAQWTANTNTAYKVYHYTKNTTGSNYTQNGNVDNLTGTSDASLTLATLTRSITGFTYDKGFAGTAASGTTIPASGSVTTTTILPDGTRVISLYYNRNSYSISYTMNGGTNYSGAPESYTYGVGATINGTPTRANSAFGGWCTDSGLTTCSASQSVSASATGNKTFYAKWTCNAGYAPNSGNTACGTSSYTVSYSCGTGGGTAPSDGTATYNVAFTAATNTCTNPNYTFAGWLPEGESSTWVNGTAWPYNTNKTFIAQWAPNSYSVTLNDGSATTTGTPHTMYVKYGTGWYTDAGLQNSIATLTRLPELQGKVFVGYFTQQDGAGTMVVNSLGAILTTTAITSSNAVLYAFFMEPKFTVTTTPLAANTPFMFGLSARGTFYVDWGDGTVDQIVRPNSTTSVEAYTHTYSTAGVKEIRFSGAATKYGSNSAIIFGASKYPSMDGWSTNTKDLIASISGSLGAIFPTIGNSSPSFFCAFRGARNLHGAIPSGLFTGVTKPKASMFNGIFSGVYGAVSIPSGLFSDLSGSFQSDMFNSAFTGSAIREIPEKLFGDNLTGSAAAAFAAMFSGNGCLQSIPADLFRNVTGANETIFRMTFNSIGTGTIVSNGQTVVNCNTLYPDADYSVPQGYIPPHLFDGLNGATASNFMQDVFEDSNLYTTCPYGTQSYDPYNYQQYWDGRVACIKTPYAITLKNQNGTSTDATVYEQYNEGWYSDNNWENSISGVSVPTRSGYAFRGYYTATQSDLTSSGGTGTQKIGKTGTLPSNTTFTADTTLYSAWAANCTQPSHGTCTLTINNDGTATYAASCNTGYTLSGNGTSTPTCTPNTLTIAFDANTGTGTCSNVTCQYDGACSAQTWNSTNCALSNGGKVLTGWNAAANGTGTSYALGANIQNIVSNGTKTLYAVWTTPTCNITHGTGSVANNTTNTPTCSVTCDSGYSTSGTYTGTQNGTSVSYSCTPNNYTITLDNGSATTNGTATLYTTKDTNVYRNSGRTEVMSTSANPITKPSRVYTVSYEAHSGSVSPTSANTTATYTFNGYYSAASNGTQYISSNGNITANGISAGKGYTSNSNTWNAQWTSGSVTLATPSRAGYTFNGWYTAATGGTRRGGAGDSYTPTADETLHAQWTANTDTAYKVYHYTKNTTGSAYTQNGNVDNLTGTSDASLTLSTLTRSITGFTYDKGFAGTAASGTTIPASGSVTTTTILPDGTRVISLYYNRNSYSISYTMNGGTNYSGAPESYTYGVGATINGTPTRANSTFGGWCTDSGLTTCSASQSVSTSATGNKTFYAKWTCNNGYTANSGNTACNANTITLNWDENSGGTIDNGSCNYAGNLVLPSAPTRTGYTFTKWKLADGTLKDASSTVTGGCTYTYTNAYSGTSTAIQAQWTANTNTAYKVYHYTKNTTGSAYTQNGNVDNLTGTSDASLTLANLTRSITGFTYDKGFAGTAASGTTIPASGSVTTTTILPDGTRVISLYYNRNSYSISYTMNGGTNYSGAPESYTYGVGATINGTPTRANSAFGGWCTDSGLTTCSASQSVSASATGDKTFYAKWTCNNGYTANNGNTACTPNNYTITLDNGSATTNGTATLYTTKDTNVYRNSGRTEVMSTSANPITKPSRVYTVSYEAHSGSVSPSSTNTTATYTFNGYYSAASNGTQYISSNGNITANGISAGKGYTSNSNTWNAQWTSGSVTLATPSRAGYTFNGWYTAATGGTRRGGAGDSYTPTADETLHAQWTANTDTAYKVYHYTKNTTGSAYTQNGNVDNLTGTSDASLTLANLTRSITGFTYDKGFAGTAASGTTIPASGSVTTTTILPDGTRVISLYYNRNSYSISYTMNGGTNYSGAPESYTYGVGATISGTPTRDNSTFGGWCTDSGLTSCATTQTIPTTATGNKTFYAKWTCNSGYTANSGNTACSGNTITLNWNENGGGAIDNGSCTYGGNLVLPAAPTRAGYTFTKWKLADGTLKDASSTVTGGCIYTYTNAYSGTSTAIQAQWTANTDTAYKVYHYTKNTSGSAYTQNGTVDNLTGTSDASLTLANLTRSITGFTYDKGFAGTAATGTTIPSSGNVTTTTILGDGTRVISLYYNRNSYNCAAGTYLPAGATACDTCLAGQYCVANIWTFNETLDQGLASCATGTNNLYSNSAAGAGTVNDCYLTLTPGKYVATAGAGQTNCATKKFSDSTANIYYGGTNTDLHPTTSTCPACSSLGGGLYKQSVAGSASTGCYFTTTAGRYITANTDAEQTLCPAAHYCTAQTLYWPSADYIMGDCPAADNTTIISTYPANFYNPSLVSWALSTTTGLKQLDACRVRYVFDNARGRFVSILYYNPSTGKYDDVHDMYYSKLNSGYYGHTKYYDDTKCNSGSSDSYRMLYVESLPCPMGSWCPGQSSMPYCNDANYTYNDTFGLNSCPVSYPNSAAISSNQNACYLTLTPGKYVATAGAGQTNCAENGYCPGAIDIYYGGSVAGHPTTGGRTACGTGLYAPAGMWESAQCGKILHVGDQAVYLRSTKQTTPSLNVDIDHDGTPDFFGNMSTLNLPMTSASDRGLKLRYNNTTYSLYDDTVSTESQPMEEEPGGGIIDGTEDQPGSISIGGLDTGSDTLPGDNQIIEDEPIEVL